MEIRRDLSQTVKMYFSAHQLLHFSSYAVQIRAGKSHNSLLIFVVKNLQNLLSLYLHNAIILNIHKSLPSMTASQFFTFRNWQLLLTS